MYRNLCMIAVLRLTTSKIYYRFISFPLEDAPIWNILLFFMIISYDSAVQVCNVKSNRVLHRSYLLLRKLCIFSRKLLFSIGSGCQKAAHNLVAGNLHKTGIAFVTLGEN